MIRERVGDAEEREGVDAIEAVELLLGKLDGERVIGDSDLARLYGVPTKRLSEPVRRHAERSPPDFCFRVEAREVASSSHGGRRTGPCAFTEPGAIVDANVLNSPQAVRMSVFVVRAFLKMRAALTNTRQLAKKRDDLEAELKSRLDVPETAIVEILERVMILLDSPPDAWPTATSAPPCLFP
ncbi:MAG: ORF6N domain-containing protein [Verrucomicrobia bacterium]|jgi:hypothetical protein|nr:ORF6N domain-containing protein [Verrucomicrobiota bacterium]